MAKSTMQLMYALPLELTGNREVGRDWWRWDGATNNVKETIFTSASNLSRLRRRVCDGAEESAGRGEENVVRVRVNERTD